MKKPLYPMVLGPLIKEKPWGSPGFGPAMNAALAKNGSAGARVGEIWLNADQEGEAEVQNGPLAGTPLTRLVLDRPWLLGEAAGPGAGFPFLLKFLHTGENLSVQVHPDDEAARNLEGAASGKTEAWHILAAEPGARLYLGFKPGVDRETVEAAGPGIVELLNQVEPRPGQTFFVPAGMVHAVGAGVSLFEIQQNADITFRLYDWGRRGAQGRARPLHTQKALSSLNFSLGPAQPLLGLGTDQGTSRVTTLALSRYFALTRVAPRGRWESRVGGDRFLMLTVIRGQGRLAAPGGFSVELDLGRTILLPAGLGGFSVEGERGLALLAAIMPALNEEVGRLVAAGFGPAEIEALAGPARPNELTGLAALEQAV